MYETHFNLPPAKLVAVVEGGGKTVSALKRVTALVKGLVTILNGRWTFVNVGQVEAVRDRYEEA